MWCCSCRPGTSSKQFQTAMRRNKVAPGCIIPNCLSTKYWGKLQLKGQPGSLARCRNITRETSLQNTLLSH